MLAMERTYLDIDWEMKFGAPFCGADPADQPERHVAHYEGRIFAIEGDGVRRRVGRVAARRCLLGQAPPEPLLGADMEFVTYGVLFARRGRFRERVARRRGDLLILDRLGLIAEYRGRDLGLVVIREATRQLGSGCAVVALIPSAMNYDHVTGQFTRARDEVAAGKLASHYRRLGFRRLGNVMHFDLSRRMKLPAGSSLPRRPPAAPPPRPFRRNSYIVV